MLSCCTTNDHVRRTSPEAASRREGNYDAGVHHAILFATDELFAHHQEYHLRRLVDDLDAGHLPGFCRFHHFNPVGLEYSVSSVL
jgi:hypothetical protein